MSKRKTQAEFVKEVNEKHNGNVEVLGQYIDCETPVLVRYKDCGHEEMKSPLKLLYAGHGCRKCRDKRCSKTKTKTTEKYISDLKNKGIDFIRVIGEYKGINQKIEVLNTKCGHTYSANAGNILSKGSGCPICHGEKDDALFAKAIEDRYPGEYTILGKYINGLTPIMVRHNPCGYEFEVVPKVLLADVKCPKCIKSKGEWHIAKYLEDAGIQYKREYTLDGCVGKNGAKLRFDFMVVINGKLKLIEYDGVQHFKDTRTRYFGNNVIARDMIKNKFCEDNGIPLLRIPYWWLRTDRAKKELDKFCSCE